MTLVEIIFLWAICLSLIGLGIASLLISFGLFHNEKRKNESEWKRWEKEIERLVQEAKL